MSPLFVVIEQRLQDPPRFLMLPADEAVILGLPILMGLIGRMLFPGLIVGFATWATWKRLKGEGGLERLLAAAYWYTPHGFGVFAPFPDAAPEVWDA